MNAAFCRPIILLSVPFILALLLAPFSKASHSNAEASSRSIVDGENFFSTPVSAAGKLPHYRTDIKPGEKIRIYLQAGTPELDQVKMIGSLKGRQREDIVKTFEKGRQELQPMMNEFNDLRKKMSASLTERMLSKEEPQMDMNTKSEDFELLLKARNLMQRLRSKRISIWEDLQAKLSSAQLDELEKLKSGQVPADYMNADPSPLERLPGAKSEGISQ